MRGRDTPTPRSEARPVEPDRMVHTRRTGGRRRRGPSRRAVLGGLLVTLAAVLTWTTIRTAGRTPGRDIVVATRTIAPGERIDAASITVRTVVMDADLATHDFSSVAQVVDGVALAPITEGAAIARSAVLADPSGERVRQFSFPVDRDRALNGDLRAGERVDVMATYGTGVESATTVITREALVLRVSEQRTGSLAASGKLIVTLGMASADQVLDAVHASQVAELTVVRATLAARSESTRDSTTGPSARSVVGARS